MRKILQTVNEWGKIYLIGKGSIKDKKKIPQTWAKCATGGGGPTEFQPP